MNRPEGLSGAELARLFADDPDAPEPGPGEPALTLPGLPPRSPITAALRRDLEHFVDTAEPSATRELAADLLRGRSDVRGILHDPAMPRPDHVELPPGVRRFLDEIDPTEPPDA